MTDTENHRRIEDCPLTRHVESMESMIGQQNWDEAARYVARDIRYQVAHKQAQHGIEGIKSYMSWQYSLVHWDGHDVRSKFSRGNIVFIEVMSHFTRLVDNAKLRVPCTDVYTFENDLIADWRVYADTSVFYG